jgi:hypothetical protein
MSRVAGSCLVALKIVDHVQDPTFQAEEVGELENRNKLVDAFHVEKQAPRNPNLNKAKTRMLWKNPKHTSK